ncbi:hypothetical protein GPA19_07920 [Azoarcus indigens]|uniref:Uncharacterized protein n=1 Tax=Azoarcus indigens TaxID=29545 RepID=A0A4R6E0W4_9RHOO|nr:hypothetical protein [Azoarcus indigens]NMG64870.1 hypothetical protein [Azoarcus indigens]TDN50408.1 hypothetical protein C7389_109102 [Azoarcus indigens]
MSEFGVPPLAAINQALALLPAVMDSPAARVMLHAIGYQESGFVHRRQVRGPARGYWQFEQGGGVAGVLRHRASSALAAAVCAARCVPTTASGVYLALDQDDVLAAAFARLLLWTDPAPLPAIGDIDAAWALYAAPRRTWSPGQPHPKRWPACYRQALADVGAPAHA